MKTTDNFKNVVSKHLETVAANDPLFAEAYKKENKNIDDCITYILNTVKNSGCNGFTDEEVFGMAIHYYDEDKIEVGKPISSNVIVNHKVELTPEEIEAAKVKAMESVVTEQKKRLTNKKVKTIVPASVQDSLFEGL
jgi:hypothetical protein